MQMNTVHSDEASYGLVCIILVQSSWIHVILASQMKVSKPPVSSTIPSEVGMPEGWSLYLLKLVPRILVQTCYSSTSYILVRVSTYRHNVKTIVGWVTVPHRYNFPLLQCCLIAMSKKL